jgi:hypothetical protein
LTLQDGALIIGLPPLVFFVLCHELVDLFLGKWLAILAIGATLLSSLPADIISIEKHSLEGHKHRLLVREHSYDVLNK